MESYIWMISILFLFVGLIGLIKLITTHKDNQCMNNIEKLHSRELAEAIIGRKIDWDD